MIEINLYYDIFIESSKNTEITHPNFENGISSAVFTLLVYVSMVTKDANKAYSLFEDGEPAPLVKLDEKFFIMA